MALQMLHSGNNTYARISSGDDGYTDVSDVMVDTQGYVDPQATLQVFRVTGSEDIEDVLNSDNPLEKYELYSIAFVKDDTLVQPNGKVTVYLPIPEGMTGDTCHVFRQETDGT